MLKLVTLRSRVLNRDSKFVVESGKVKLDDYVVFETEEEVGFGKIILVELINDSHDKGIKRAKFRIADKPDFEKISELAESERKTLKFVKNEVRNYFEFVKIIDVEYSFNKKKLYIFFSSEERVDFKILINLLFKKLKVWIEFKQLSARDLAKILGGIGVCGRIICCKSFLRNVKKLNSSSIVNQKIYIGGTKYCGVCGRLMCCLEYEEKIYSQSLKTMPDVGNIVQTPKGVSVVVSVNAISQMVQVASPDNPNLSFWLKNSDIEIVEK